MGCLFSCFYIVDTSPEEEINTKTIYKPETFDNYLTDYESDSPPGYNSFFRKTCD